MQYSPEEIKERLLKALDKDNNVVDMVAVLDIVTYLEEHPITKEALEQTRLGRYVNELRKKTKNEDLAKRAKKLVRSWQKLIPTPAAGEGPVNGERLATPRTPATPSHADAVKRQELKGNISPALSSRPTTPFPRTNTSPNNLISRPGTPLSSSVNSSRSQTPITAVNKLVQNNVRKPASPALSAIKPNMVNKCTPPSSPALKPSNNDVNRNCTPQNLDKTNAANKKRRRDELDDVGLKKVKSVSNNDGRLGNNSKDFTPDWIRERESVMNGAKESKARLKLDIQLAKTPVNTCYTPKVTFGSNVTNLPLKSTSSTKSDSEKSLQTKDLMRTPKVKTTAQLIAELQAKTGTSNISSDTYNKIATNQIQKELDVEVSIVPAGAKPRPRRKPGTTVVPPAASESALIQTKTEMVHKFLQSSCSSRQGSVDSETSHVISKVDQTRTASPTFSDLRSQSDVSPPLDQSADSEQLRSDESKLDDSKTSDSVDQKPVPKEIIDPYSLLPPLNLDEIVWDDEAYTVPEKLEVNEESVRKMEEDECPGLNGYYDKIGSWRTWADTYSVPTVGEDVLHILPYVDIGD